MNSLVSAKICNVSVSDYKVSFTSLQRRGIWERGREEEREEERWGLGRVGGRQMCGSTRAPPTLGLPKTLVTGEHSVLDANHPRENCMTRLGQNV
jgi:hypothetical protein